MRLIFASLLTAFAFSAHVVAETESTPSTATVLADGHRLTHKSGFSITPPQGWEVNRDYGGSSFVFQVPPAKGLVYQRTIDIKVFKDGVYIDAFTEDDYGRKIVEKFSRSTSSIQNYTLRSKERVTTASGQEGILYYTQFTLDGAPMMQMHILLSGKANHFLMSFTDVAETFTEHDSPILNEAYQSMITAQIPDPIGSRYDFPVILGVAAGVLFIGGLIASMVRRMIHSRRYIDGESSDELLSGRSTRTHMEEEEDDAAKLVSHYSEAEADGDKWEDSEFSDDPHSGDSTKVS